MARKNNHLLTVGGIVLAVAILACGAWLGIRAARGGNELNTAERVMICSETGKVYNYEPKEGEVAPYPSPYSKKRTGYRAERCYWTKDGKAKLEPTYVLLNEDIGKPGPTICPDCGREVRRHNPMPPPELLEEAARAAGRK
jgi:hypothetical protein